MEWSWNPANVFSLIGFLFSLLQESEKQIAVDVTQLDIPAELALVFANIQGRNEKTATATVTPHISDSIGWTKKNNRAARAARFLVHFFLCSLPNVGNGNATKQGFDWLNEEK